MTDRHKTRQTIKTIIISLILLLFFSYTGYEIQRVAFGPKIKVLSPVNGALVSDSFTEIKGVATNIKDISINDRKIVIDEQGNFSEKILLSYGYNAISIKAIDKFGQNTEKIIEVIYK